MGSILVVGLANGAFAPPFRAAGFLEAPAMMNPTLMRFAIVSATVLIATSLVAALHFHFVERRFLAMRPSAGASRGAPQTLFSSGTGVLVRLRTLIYSWFPQTPPR